MCKQHALRIAWTIARSIAFLDFRVLRWKFTYDWKCVNTTYRVPLFCPLPASRKGLRLTLRSALFGEGGRDWRPWNSARWTESVKPNVCFSSSNFVGVIYMYIRRIRYLLYLEVAKFWCKSFKGPRRCGADRKGWSFCQKLPLLVALVAVLRQCSDSGVVHSLFIVASFVCGGGVWSLFCCAVFSVLSRFVVILLRKREMLALLLNAF